MQIHYKEGKEHKTYFKGFRYYYLLYHTLLLYGHQELLPNIALLTASIALIILFNVTSGIAIATATTIDWYNDTSLLSFHYSRCYQGQSAGPLWLCPVVCVSDDISDPVTPTVSNSCV